jgi:hypothetical protein
VELCTKRNSASVVASRRHGHEAHEIELRPALRAHRVHARHRRREKRISTQINFSDERLDGVEGALSVRDRIIEAFRHGTSPNGASAKDISELLAIPLKTARNKLAS